MYWAGSIFRTLKELIVLSTVRLHKLLSVVKNRIAVSESRAVLAVTTGPAAGLCPQSLLNFGALNGSCEFFNASSIFPCKRM